MQRVLPYSRLYCSSNAWGFLNTNGFNPTYTAGLALKKAKGRSGFCRCLTFIIEVENLYLFIYKSVYVCVCVYEVFIYI